MLDENDVIVIAIDRRLFLKYLDRAFEFERTDKTKQFVRERRKEFAMGNDSLVDIHTTNKIATNDFASDKIMDRLSPSNFESQ